MKLEFTGSVKDNKLHIYHRAVFDSLICKLNSKEVEIIIQQKRKKRSGQQNRYYFGVIIPVIQQGLFDTQGEWLNTDDVHEFLKANFNYKELVNKDTGEVIKVPKTTTESTTIEFEEYLDIVRQFADEFLNIIIPLPNEQSNLI